MRFKEMLNHLWTSHRNAIVMLTVLLIFNIISFVAIEQFFMPHIEEKETRFLKRQAEVRAILHNQVASARSPEQMYVLASQDMSKFKQSIPPYRDFTTLIEELLALSDKADLNITQIRYDAEMMIAASLLQLSLSFNVSGDYGDIKKFIHSIEQSARLIAIKQISLQGESGDTVNLRLALETYFQPGERES